MTKNIKYHQKNAYLILLILIALSYKKGFCQINVSHTVQQCNCIRIELKNKSADTVYAISQNYSIHYKDSCFAYTIIKRDEPKNGHVLSLTYYDDGMDGYFMKSNSRMFYLYPDSTFLFGARSNEKINSDSLFVNIFIGTLPIKKGEEFNVLENRKRKAPVVFHKWRTFYCPTVRNVHQGIR